MADRNSGLPFDRRWIEDVQINRAAVERRAGELTASRRLTGPWQAAWLIRAVECLDLTTLAGDDTPGWVARLAEKAKQPVDQMSCRRWE